MPDPLQSPPRELPAGVVLRPLADGRDRAGGVTALYRADRDTDVVPVQWNFVCTRANTLRGVHVHATHADYLCVLRGEMLLALHDMRPHSPTYRLAVECSLPAEAPQRIAIPPGVAHGFYFAAETSYVYAVSEYWNPADELGCRWDDPELGICWPATDPLLSPRDAGASSYADMARDLAAAIARQDLHACPASG